MPIRQQDFEAIRDQEVAGSNPVTPIDASPCHAGACVFPGLGLSLPLHFIHYLHVAFCRSDHETLANCRTLLPLRGGFRAY